MVFLYQGGKTQLGPIFYPEILKLEALLLAEKGTLLPVLIPMAGMLGIGRRFLAYGEPVRSLTICDLNPEVVAVWQAIQQGWVLSEEDLKCDTKEEYLEWREKPSSIERTAVKLCNAYNSVDDWGSYRCDKDSRHLKESKRRLLQVQPSMSRVTVLPAASYEKHVLSGGPALIIYDPPYLNNTYARSNPFFKFDHTAYWATVRAQSVSNIVVTCEYVAPPDFVCVFERAARGKKERLFIWEGYFNGLSAFQMPEQSNSAHIPKPD